MSERAETADAHAEVYRLLAACFCQPDMESMREERVFAQLVDAVEECCKPAVANAKDLASEAARTDPTELLVDYSRLFLGPSRLLAPPYGSVYLDEERQVMGPTTLRVAEVYARCGIAVAQDVSEVPDHIAIELEFLALAMAKASQAKQEGKTPEQQDWMRIHDEFLLDLVATWTPEFTSRMINGSESLFYPRLARCLHAFLSQQSSQARGRLGGRQLDDTT